MWSHCSSLFVSIIVIALHLETLKNIFSEILTTITKARYCIQLWQQFLSYTFETLKQFSLQSTVSQYLTYLLKLHINADFLHTKQQKLRWTNIKKSWKNIWLRSTTSNTQRTKLHVSQKTYLWSRCNSFVLKISIDFLLFKKIARSSIKLKVYMQNRGSNHRMQLKQHRT